MPKETQVEGQVRKLFLQTEAAYESELHTSFSPHKVNLHPIPQQQQSSSRPHTSHDTTTGSLGRKQPIHMASTPLLRPLTVGNPSTTSSASPHPSPFPCKREPPSTAEILHPCDAASTPVVPPKRKPLASPSRNFQSMSDNLLLEMKDFVANRKKSTGRPAKGSDVPRDVKPAREGSSARLSPTKFQRGMHVQMQCYLEYAHLHSKSTRHLNVNPSPTKTLPSSHILVAPSPQKFLQKEGGKDSMHNLQENSSYQKLLRKLAPSITNSATTYMSLVHVLQGCHNCGGRVTFCDACERSANEYFNKFSMSELEKSYGRQLPPPDATVVAEYEKYLELREKSMKHKLQ